MALFEAAEGGMVAIVGDPPALVIDDPGVSLPAAAPDLVRVRSGPLAGAEGTWAGLAGPRRFPAGVTLEAAFVRFGGRPPVAIPIGDLERFALTERRPFPAPRWSGEPEPRSDSPLAARLASVALPGDILCLWGDLGAGKTVFAKGFGLGLGSPTRSTLRRSC